MSSDYIDRGWVREVLVVKCSCADVFAAQVIVAFAMGHYLDALTTECCKKIAVAVCQLFAVLNLSIAVFQTSGGCPHIWCILLPCADGLSNSKHADGDCADRCSYRLCLGLWGKKEWRVWRVLEKNSRITNHSWPASDSWFDSLRWSHF